MKFVYLCHKCHSEWTSVDPPTRKDLCYLCHSPIHACLNCKFYDTARSKQCVLDEAELVTEKDKANFCEYFKFRSSDLSHVTAMTSDMTKQKWSSLFRKS